MNLEEFKLILECKRDEIERIQSRKDTILKDGGLFNPEERLKAAVDFYTIDAQYNLLSWVLVLLKEVSDAQERKDV